MKFLRRLFPRLVKLPTLTDGVLRRVDYPTAIKLARQARAARVTLREFLELGGDLS